MNISKMKKAAEKLIAAEGRKETLAALSGFAQVCGPEEVLELINLHERVAVELNSVHEWCFQALAARDYTARQQAATLRAVLVNVMGGDDKEWLGRVRNKVASFVSIHGPNRRMGYAACPKFLADAVGVLLATHPSNNKAAIHDAEANIPDECLDGRLCLLVCTGGELPTDEADQWLSLGFKNGQNAAWNDWHLVGWLWEHDEFVDIPHSLRNSIIVHRAIDLKKFLLENKA